MAWQPSLGVRVAPPVFAGGVLASVRKSPPAETGLARRLDGFHAFARQLALGRDLPL
jgi:hypothetical protein